MQIRFLALSFLASLAFAFTPVESQAFKWRDRRQSSNVIDIRKETKAVSLQMSLEAGRRYLVAMMMTAELDALEQPDCVVLNQEVEKLKTVRIELEAMGAEPVRRLVCVDEAAGSRVNLCARAFAKDPAAMPAAPAIPDLKEFEDELIGNYRPAMEQVARVQAAIDAKSKTLSKEDLKCKATLVLIQKKSSEILETYGELQSAIQEFTRQTPN